MRAIKFRGKRMYGGEWVYGCLVANNIPNGKVMAYILTVPKFAESFDTWKKETFLVDPETIGQFTGLCDKNGKEVYEGDIVRFRVSDNRYKKNPRYITKTIRYDNRSARFEADGIFWINLSSERIEVIGNMFDCPELKEKGGQDENN